ncbi:DUF2637 domain-containing protein [Frankia sp. Cas3]|uniref:DUF2637 domain-containing protein n=1 Tax=Frankia sp. Cas3 TaxID=3073926 RepID=UPI002AD54885|nr:DUF2637 domain-containing protein [Frankia sp. Cas3]
MNRRTLSAPLLLALVLVAAVWAAGCVWSFEEQRTFAHRLGFHVDWLLPTVADGLPVAMAAVAFAAAVNGRAATAARLGTLLAVGGSVASNALNAATRTHGDRTTIVVAAAIPVLAGIAFEVLLGELRKQVLHRRGLATPAPIPTLRPVRLVLSPRTAWTEWRTAVLLATAPGSRPSTPDTHVPAEATPGWDALPVHPTLPSGTSVPALPGSHPDAVREVTGKRSRLALPPPVAAAGQDSVDVAERLEREALAAGRRGTTTDAVRRALHVRYDAARDALHAARARIAAQDSHEQQAPTDPATPPADDVPASVTSTDNEHQDHADEHVPPAGAGDVARRFVVVPPAAVDHDADVDEDQEQGDAVRVAVPV